MSNKPKSAIRSTVASCGLLLLTLLTLLTGCDEADDRIIEFVVAADLEAASSIPTIDEIAPYDEALTVCEYRVHHLISGPKTSPKKGSKIRVAYWTVVAGENQPPLENSNGIPREMKLTPLNAIPGLDEVYQRNDLDFDPAENLYLDLSQSLATPAPPEKVRYDYRGPISHRMRIYWLARHQLRLAVIGNSHAGAAVNPQQFYQPENQSTPVALNLSIAGSELKVQALIAENYLVNLPNLEWIVWGISPRIFNKYHAYDRRGEMFTSSPGFVFDQKVCTHLWPDGITGEPVSAKTLEDAANHEIEPWGWSPATHRDLPLPITVEAGKKILDRCRSTHFRWNNDAWEEFSRTVKLITANGIKLILFTPPYHPLVKQGKTADFDGTGHDDYRYLVSRMAALAQANGKIVFLDIHQAGHHEFFHEDFADPDHLHRSGAEKLTRRLVETITLAQ